MSLFVSPEDRFKVTVRYVEDGDRTRILEDDETDVKEAESVTVTCRKPNFEISQVILHASTILTDDGAPVVDMLRVRKTMLYHLATDWDVTEKGKPVPLTPEKISQMNPAIAAALCGKIQMEVGDPVAVLMG
jgi:hypothetical protein